MNEKFIITYPFAAVINLRPAVIMKIKPVGSKLKRLAGDFFANKTGDVLKARCNFFRIN